MPLDGVEIQVHPCVGRTAVLYNRKVLVSPAMWNLLSHADEEELQKLLKSIPVFDADRFEMNSQKSHLYRPLKITQVEY